MLMGVHIKALLGLCAAAAVFPLCDLSLILFILAGWNSGLEHFLLSDTH